MSMTDAAPSGGQSEWNAPLGTDHGRRRKTVEHSSAPASPYRPELQGLRAVAIMMVVCYHIWFDRVSGGVDIFLLISAFLLTGSFARKLESGAPLSVPAYWIHAFKRLLPPAVVVIVLTVTAGFFILPPSGLQELSTQAFASLTYWQNWRLAFQGIDYYAADQAAASPLQHFWSLSIQGQVFLLWPALFLCAAVLVRKLRMPARPTLTVLFGTLTVASLAWSIHITATQQALAYFDTRARLWEFALGSLLALVLPTVERALRYRTGGPNDPNGARIPRVLLGWAGILAILACGWVVDIEGAFPGYIALWPLLAACAVIIAGPTHTRWGVDRILSSRPLLWLGDISYALYLVHWPLLILSLVHLQLDRLDAIQGSAVVALSVVLGWLLTKFVDTPVRRSEWLRGRAWRGLAAIAAAVVIGLVPTITLNSYLNRSVPEAGSPRYPGAHALLPGAGPVPSTPATTPFVPALDQVEQEWFWYSEPCELAVDVTIGCDQLLPEGTEYSTLVLAYGNSHTQQQLAGFDDIATANGWQVKRPTYGGCGYSIDAAADPGSPCPEWNQRMRELITVERPAAVILTSTQVDDLRSGEEEVTPGYEELAQFILDEGIDVIAIRDNPRFDQSIPECLFEGDPDSSECGTPREAIYAAVNPTPAVESASGAVVYTVDLADQYCPGGQCAPIIGNVLVYFDDNHVSTSYGRTLGPFVQRTLKEQGFPY